MPIFTAAAFRAVREMGDFDPMALSGLDAPLSGPLSLECRGPAPRPALFHDDPGLVRNRDCPGPARTGTP
ncbi:MAG: hypothetical protein D6795_05250 [Deltaproteobacteria bacterium]|nr:MAG: hypothetical protein D6795_05250 [Deltaproteobacteria bacterium]